MTRATKLRLWIADVRLGRWPRGNYPRHWHGLSQDELLYVLAVECFKYSLRGRSPLPIEYLRIARSQGYYKETSDGSTTENDLRSADELAFDVATHHAPGFAGRVRKAVRSLREKTVRVWARLLCR